MDQDLCDCAWINYAALGLLKNEDGKLKQYPVIVLTLDDPKATFNRLSLYKEFLEDLQSTFPDWRLPMIYSGKVICLNEHPENPGSIIDFQ